MIRSTTRTTLAILTAVSLLAGCGGGDDANKPASQTAAKVNGDEITVHQINAELQRAASSMPQGADTDAVSKRILENLVDQTLLVQKAKEAKLDRDPQVYQRLEAARRQILAQAYVDHQAAATPPSSEEIQAFYAKNPDLFEKRKVYAFREFLFERARFTDDVRNQLNAAKGPADVAKVLNDAGIKYRETNSRRAAESLPIDALPRIAQMNKGDTLAFTDQNVANVFMLLDVAEQSVPMDRATPLIQQYLVNQKKREIAQNTVKEMRAQGKIEYVGNFAKSEGDDKAAEKKAVEAAPAVPTPPPAAAGQGDHMDKGVSGLR